MKIYKDALTGAFWLLLIRVISMLLSFTSSVIYARYLNPGVFGLIGIGHIVISLTNSCSQMGIKEALIQKNGSIDNYLDVGWTMQLIRGIILYLIMYILSPVVATYFNAPSSVWIIRLLGLTILINSFDSIRIVYFIRNLDFSKRFIFEVLPTLLSVIIGIFIVVIYKNIWGLVVSSLIRSIIQLFVSYYIANYIPKLRMHKHEFLKILSFGKWLFLTGILFFITSRFDNVIVGRYLGVVSLGIYSYSFNFVDKSIVQGSKIISSLTFPIFSKVQSDRSKIAKGLYLSIDVINLGLLYVVAGILVCYRDFVLLLLGMKWFDTILIVKVLSISSLISTYRSIAVYISLGKTKFQFIFELFRASTMVFFMYVLFRFEMLGVSIAVLLGNFVATLAWFISLKLYIDIRYRDILFRFFISTVICCITVCLSNFIQLILVLPLAFNFIFSIFNVTIIFFAINYLLYKFLNLGPIGNVLIFLKKTKN